MFRAGESDGSMAFGVIRNVRKVFQVDELGSTALEPVVALDDASFQFEQGDLVALLGPSGCGKTTLLRIVGGLIAKSAGSVAIGGREVTRPMGDYGFVFQAPSLMPWRNVLDNVLFPMEILRKNDAAARRHALELLDLVGLTAFLSARPHQLSGGMQQRVALCRALIHRPRLLLMDEPFGALDELTRMDMNDLLLRIRYETKASVLFVTHSISEAVYLSDKVVVFSKRPARVAKEIPIPLAYPRSHKVRFTAAFTSAERIASEALGVIAPSAEEVAAP
jgi:NitT/TauT family transport system ATP-binding protein